MTLGRSVIISLNNTVQISIKQRPSIMLFGVEQRGRESDLFKEELGKLLENEDARDMERIRKDAANCQIKAQEYNKRIADKKEKKLRNIIRKIWL